MNSEQAGRASVTVQIRGGLGNQLFMYSMARRLASANNVPLFLEVRSGFTKDFYKREYGLDRFNVIGSEVKQREYSKVRRAVSIGLNSLLPFSRRVSYHETSQKFDHRYQDLRVRCPVYLYGYWQDECYFSDIREQLKSELTLRGSRHASSERLAQEMRGCEAVAVHLRMLHGVPAGSEQVLPGGKNLPVEYYQWAIEEIKRRVTAPKLYLFSDKREVPASLISQLDVTRVASEGEDATYEDIWLMSQCRHFVIANSTFSWWGAWLGREADSVVVSPSTSEWVPTPKLPKEWNAIEWSQSFEPRQR